jgi:hypothetical protein
MERTSGTGAQDAVQVGTDDGLLLVVVEKKVGRWKGGIAEPFTGDLVKD